MRSYLLCSYMTVSCWFALKLAMSDTYLIHIRIPISHIADNELVLSFLRWGSFSLLLMEGYLKAANPVHWFVPPRTTRIYYLKRYQNKHIWHIVCVYSQLPVGHHWHFITTVSVHTMLSFILCAVDPILFKYSVHVKHLCTIDAKYFENDT